jgi:hypothetical protein
MKKKQSKYPSPPTSNPPSQPMDWPAMERRARKELKKAERQIEKRGRHRKTGWAF